MSPEATPLPRRGVPFNTFVVKVVSRCNLNCSYCYMYNLQDRTYRGQPAVMTDETTLALGRRIAEHSRRHGLGDVHVILHGGEPMLMGVERFRSWMSVLRRGVDSGVRAWFSMQSNGILVDAEWIEALAAEEVRIGISVDGPKAWHDRFRVDHAGRGSFDETIRGIRRLQRHVLGTQVFSSVMAVVNTDIPPEDLYEFWNFLDVNGFDLSLPHANHAHPPPRGAIPYGEWMVRFFDLWFDDNKPYRSVRYFENMLRMIFEYPMSTDNIGGKPVGVVVVETDGSIEPTDAFKCCEEGITKLGVNVLRDQFDSLYSYGMVSVLQHGVERLCSTCQECLVRDVCGGGYMPHRYREENGFDNPSVYCEDLFELICHIRRRVLRQLPEEVLQRAQQVIQ